MNIKMPILSWQNNMTGKMLDVIWFMRLGDLNSWHTLKEIKKCMLYVPAIRTINTLVKNNDLLTKEVDGITYYSINFED